MRLPRRSRSWSELDDSRTPADAEKARFSFPLRAPGEPARLIFAILILLGTFGVFVFNPALSTPTMLALLTTLLLSPAVAALERFGLSRTVSISFVFVALGALLVAGGFLAAQAIEGQWASFTVRAPEIFDRLIETIRSKESAFAQQFAVAPTISLAEKVLVWGQDTGHWFIGHIPVLLGDLATSFLIVPVLVWVLLKDGRRMRKGFFSLIPNRHFESSYIVVHRILGAISDYIRAKLFEGILVGSLVTLGLFLVGAPYPIVLGVIAGVTNIIPYLGPLLGAAPGIVIALYDESLGHLLVPVVAVYGVANLVDTVVIFPVLVGRLVNLHPAILLVSVIVGGQFWGFIGMLLSIPVTASLKIILEQVHGALYPTSRSRRLRLVRHVSLDR